MILDRVVRFPKNNHFRQIQMATPKAIATSQFTERGPKLLSPVWANCDTFRFNPNTPAAAAINIAATAIRTRMKTASFTPQ